MNIQVIDAYAIKRRVEMNDDYRLVAGCPVCGHHAIDKKLHFEGERLYKVSWECITCDRKFRHWPPDSEREASMSYDYTPTNELKTIHHVGTGEEIDVKMAGHVPEQCPSCESNLIDEYTTGWKCEVCKNEFARLPPEAGNQLPLMVGQRVVEIDDLGRRECCGIAPIQGGEIIEMDGTGGVSVKMDSGEICEFETHQVRGEQSPRIDSMGFGRDTTPLSLESLVKQGSHTDSLADQLEQLALTVSIQGTRIDELERRLATR